MSSNERLGIDISIDNVVSDQSKLEGQIKATVSYLQRAIGDIDIFKDIKGQMDSLAGALGGLQGTFVSLSKGMGEIKGSVEEVKTSLKELHATQEAAFTNSGKGASATAAEVETLNKSIEGLLGHFNHLDAMKGDKLTAMKKLFEEIGLAIEKDGKQVETLWNKLSDNKKSESFFKALDKYGEGSTASSIKLALQAKKEQDEAANVQAITERRDVELAKIRGANQKRWNEDWINRQKAYNKEREAVYADLFDKIEAGEKALSRRIAIEQQRQVEAAAIKASSFRNQTAAAIRIGRLASSNGIVDPDVLAGSGAASAWTPKISEALANKAPNAPANPYRELLKDLPALSTGLAEIHAALKLTASDIKNLKPDQIEKLTAALRPFKVGVDAANGSLVALKKNDAFSVFGASFGQMAMRLLEFYSFRTVLFGISNQVRDAAKELIHFNQSLHDTAAIANSTEKEMNRVGNAAMGIAVNSKMSLTEVMKLMNILAQSGVEGKDVPAVAKVTSMFATGTGSSAENAVRVMTTAMNVWNITADGSARIANTLAAGLNASKLEVQDLSTVFNYLAPVAKQVGMNLEETTGAIAALSQAGVKASTIGTSMSEMLSKLMAPTPKLVQLFSQYKISLDEVNPRLHTVADVIERLGKADIPLEKLYSAFGPRAGRSLEGFLTLGPDYVRMMTENVSGTQAAFTAQVRVMEGTEAKINVIKQNLVQSVGEIFNSFNTNFKGILEVLNNFAVGLGTAGGKITLAIAGIITGVELLSISLTKLNPVVAVVTAALAVVSTAVAHFGKEHEETYAKADNAIKEYAKSASALQRGFTTLSSMYAEAAKSGKAHADMTLEDKNTILELNKTFPHLFDNLDISKMKYDDLTKAMKNANKERIVQMRQNMGEYNELADRMEAVDAKYADRKAAAKRRIEEGRAGMNMPGVGKGGYAASKALMDAGYTQLNEIENQIDKEKGNGQQRMDSLVRPDLVKVTYANGRKVRTLDEDKIAQELSENLRKDNKPPKPDPNPRERTAEIDSISEAIKTKELEIQKWKKEMKDTSKSTEELLALQKNIDDNYDEIYNLETSRVRKRAEKYKDPKTGKMAGAASAYLANGIEEARQRQENGKEGTAQDLKARLDKYADEARAFTDATEKLDDAEQQRKELARQKLLEKEISDIHRTEDERTRLTLEAKEAATKAIDARAAREEKGLTEKWMKLPDEQKAKTAQKYVDGLTRISSAAVADKDTAHQEIDDKAAAAAIANLDYRLKVQREILRTSQEESTLNARDLVGYAAVKANLQDRINKELESLSVEETLTRKKLDQQLSLDEQKKVQADIEAIEMRRRVLNKDLADTQRTALQNAKKGAADEWTSFSNTDKLSHDLGGSVVSTGLNGMVSVIDQSINKLKDLKWSWKDFAHSLGDIMKDISAQLQTYMVKMMVVWAVQKMLGWFGSSNNSIGGDTGTFGGTNSSIFGQMGSVSPSYPSVFKPNALGGLQVGGIPGKDSILALTMPGEVVIKKSSVDAIGVDKLLYANEHGKLPRFATGGAVGGRGSSNNSDDGQPFTLQIVNITQGDQIPDPGKQAAQIINVINSDIAKRGPSYQAIKGILSR